MAPLSWLLRFLVANWLILLILALLLLFVGLLFRRRSERRLAAETAAEADPDEVEATVEMVPPTAPIPTPREIRRTVSAGFRALRKRITSWRLRYRTPLFLLIGPGGSGKTAILKELAPEVIAPADQRDAAGSRWHFFERAVVVEVDGRLLLSSRQASASEAGWRALLKGIGFHRPERPIDGIILTLPADQLVGPRKLDAEALAARGREIFSRLQASQRVLGVRVPIYLLVTKCDLVPGFQEFSDAIPDEARDEIFGWSSPYALETAFIPEWIDQAFDSLGQDISTVQVELLADGRAPEPEEFFHFSRSFRSLHGPLRVFTTELCRPSAYQEPFYFRGVYFTGDGTSDLGERLAQIPQLGLEGAPVPDRESVLPPLPAALPVSRDPVFLKGLFNQKIFAEKGLTSAVAQSTLSRNRVILAIQAAIVAIIVIGGLGLWRADEVLHQESAVLLEVLTTIEDDLSAMDRIADDPQGRTGTTRQLGERVFPLLTAMARIDDARLASFFVPSSWFSPLNGDIDESMQLGFTNVVIPALRSGLLAKADSLVMPSFESAYAVGLDARNLETYLGSIGELGTNLRRYRAVSTDSALAVQLEGLAALVTYLYGADLPPEFLTDDEFYRRALDTAYGTQIRAGDRPNYPEDVVARAERLLRDYYDAVILRLEDIEGRYQTAELSDQLSATDLGDFRMLRGDLGEIDRVFGGTEPYWFDESREIGGALDALLDSIPDTPLTPSAEIRREFEEIFYRVRSAKLEELNSRLGNDVVTSDYLRTTAPTGDPSVSLPPRLLSLRGALDTLFTQPFLAAAPPDNRPLSLPRTERTRWDAAALDRALQDYEQYQELLSQLPPEYSAGMRRLAQGLASVQLESRLNQGLLDAISPEPPSYTFGMADRERELRSRVAAFQDPSTRLIQIMEIARANGMAQTYDELAGAYVELALSLLAETDALLEEGGAYRSVGGGLSNWDGDEPVMDAAFQVGNEEELDRYLAQQRSRIRYLVDNFAAPLLGGLLSPPIVDYLGGPNSNSLVAKWRGLVEELDQYEAGSGASSLLSLEEFIREEMSAEDVTTCIANSSSRLGSGGDFFLAARSRLRTQLYSRCLELAEEQAEVRYERLARYFNLNLAGRFPFAPRPTEPGAPEAGIGELRELYRLMDALGPFRVAVPDDARLFLERLDEVRAFLAPVLALDASATAPVFDVSVEFRTNRDAEAGADQVVDWVLRVGQSRASYRSPGNPPAPWAVGDPVELMVSWALQSVERPDSAGSGYVTEARDAVYRYRGRWALLRFIQDHAAEGPGGEQGFLLRFDIPTVRLVGSASVPGRNARLYLRLRLAYPEGGSSPPLPDFPVRAPEYQE